MIIFEYIIYHGCRPCQWIFYYKYNPYIRVFFKSCSQRSAFWNLTYLVCVFNTFDDRKHLSKFRKIRRGFVNLVP